MKKEENHIHFSAEDIRKYLDGKLDDRHMQAIEKASLEDPFLADVIEGMKEVRKQKIVIEDDITDLRQRLRDRIGRRRHKAGIFQLSAQWKVAASVLLILGLTFITYRFITFESKSDLAVKTEKKNTALPPNPPADSGVINAPSEEKKSPEISAEKKENTSQPVVPEFEKLKNKANADETESAQKDKTGVPADSVNEEFMPAHKKSMTISPAAASPSSAAASSIDERKLADKVPGLEVESDRRITGNYIQGVVIDKKGNPLPNAEVKLKGSAKHTFTDTSGFFKLYMKDPRLASLVFSHHDGYQSATLELLPDSAISNTVQLQDKNEMFSDSEKNEPGNAASRRRAKELTEVSGNQNLQNIKGWETFERYVNEHKTITGSDSLLKGAEIISFNLTTDGQRSSYRIEQSVSPSHDAAILNLVKTAPALQLISGKKQRCYLRISYP